MRGLDVAATVIKRAPETESPGDHLVPGRAGGAPDMPGARARASPRPGPVRRRARAPSGRDAAVPPPRRPRSRATPARPIPARARRDGVRLTAEKLDGLRDLVAELLLTRVRLERSAGRAAQRQGGGAGAAAQRGSAC